MGAITISSTLLSSNLLLLLLLLLLSLKQGYVLGRREAPADSHQLQHSHTVHVSSLLPSSVCSPSAKALDKKSSLQVVHKHGPCSQLHQDKANIPTHAEVLLQDEARVKSIHSRLGRNPGSSDVDETDAAQLPAKDGSVVGSGNYIVTVGLGTPKKGLSLVFDTGSDITWTQCQPCAKSCYKQRDPIFAPSQSSTYSNISCTSTACSSLTSATVNSPGCASSACVYGIQYGDSSFSVGFFAKEKLTLTPTDEFDNFLFGCGQNNQGLFGGSAGLLGLGRDQLSLPSQTASKYKKFFSYCLPSSASSDGFLAFGYGGGVSKSVKFTTLSTVSQGESFYGIDITGISVGGQKLSISASLFTTAGTIIDSGTVITRLPPTAYAALRSSFRQKMTQYPRAQALSILDTCYDFSKYSSVSVPKISFFFSGGVEVPIDAKGILYANSISQVCLAFAGNSDDTDIGIVGNTQQKTLQVVYDGAGGRIGFATGACS
ncbi:Xylanase inhibitor [Theobroma cacao]|nr:Xylanase inhibitor [Theobroma cacao]